MITLTEMAKSHLANIESEIIRLQNQKNQIDLEIQKLSEYLKLGLETLKSEANI